MDKFRVLQTIRETGIVAILRSVSEEQALQIASALYEGGVRAIEVTCNTPGYLSIIERLSQTMGEKMAVGAGTVLNPAAAQLVMDAGASFVLAPDVNRKVIQLVHQNQKLAIPGVTTPSEILGAYRLGVDIVKLFPSGALGARYLKELRGPLNQAVIMPVGGINLSNIGDFIQAGAAAFGIGGELIDQQAIAGGNYSLITEKAKRFIEVCKTRIFNYS